MEIDFSFAPNAARARALDARMHRELGDSLHHLCEAAEGTISFDRAGMDSLVTLLARDGAVEPFIFGRYYELVEAIQQGDLPLAELLFAELATSASAPVGLTIHTLGGQTLGPESARYLAKMNADESLDLGFMAPSIEVDRAFRERLKGGLAVLDQSLPELSGEFRGIVRQIVIAGSDPTKAYQFDGGSHYQLWGALFLNGNYHPDEIAVAEVLAHESAHSLLFGFCIDEALVENGDDERYASPLRADERPMDGIYHATFVSARMHWAISRLVERAVLTPDQKQRAIDAADADRSNFSAGYSVVAEHGRLTNTGRHLMAGAKSYMDTTR